MVIEGLSGVGYMVHVYAVGEGSAQGVRGFSTAIHTFIAESSLATVMVRLAEASVTAKL
jgi:hypothetical protein